MKYSVLLRKIIDVWNGDGNDKHITLETTALLPMLPFEGLKLIGIVPFTCELVAVDLLSQIIICQQIGSAHEDDLDTWVASDLSNWLQGGWKVIDGHRHIHDALGKLEWPQAKALMDQIGWPAKEGGDAVA